MRAALTRLLRVEHASAWAVLAGYLLLIVARLVDAEVSDPHISTLLAVIFELIIFILPAALYLLLRRERPEAGRLWLVRPSARRVLPCAAALVGLSCLCTLLTLLICGNDTAAGGFELYSTFTARADGSLGDSLRLIVCYALLPAICEELMFRGLVCADYRSSGAIVATVMTSLLFGMLHLDLRLLPVYISAGVVLCLLLFATRSLISCMAVHLLYNCFGIFVRPYLTAFYLTTGSRALFLMLAVALLLISAAVFCFSAARLYRTYDDAAVDYPVGLGAAELPSAARRAVVSLPLWLCAVVFIIGVIVF